MSKVDTPHVIEFGDWASGTSTAPDFNVLERHVAAMVEVCVQGRGRCVK